MRKIYDNNLIMKFSVSSVFFTFLSLYASSGNGGGRGPLPAESLCKKRCDNHFTTIKALVGYILAVFVVVFRVTACTQLFQLRLSPEQSGKVEYERERLLGIANKFIQDKGDSVMYN